MEKLSPIKSNQQICDFSKSVDFQKQRHCKIFDISKLFSQCSRDSCCEHITGGGVNIC